MSEQSFQKQAEHWGQTFEVLVKRGGLACLVEKQLVAIDDPRLKPWREVKLARVCGALTKALEIIDVAAGDVVKAAFDHMALTAYGLGYTAMREYLRPHEKFIGAGKVSVKGLYCPLALPGEHSNTDEDRQIVRAQFATGFGLTEPFDESWTFKGMPARADFTLWLSGAKDDLLLAQEYSYDTPAELSDFNDESAHLDELMRHRRMVDSRGVFARMTAEVEGETFELAEDLKNSLSAFTSDDKPLYKLCQGCGYVEATVRLLRDRGLLAQSCMARALAITPNGLESISALFDAQNTPNSRRRLMEQMAQAYRLAVKLPEDDEGALTRKADEVFNKVRRRLPLELQRKMRELGQPPEPGSDFAFEFNEGTTDFANPMQRFSSEEALSLIGGTPELDALFGKPATQAVAEAMRVVDGQVTLRDLHAGAIIAGMRAAKKGQINVLALEGNPGIGKTTAVTAYLGQQPEGFLFLYVSPRVIINRDVTDKLARRDRKATGTLTVTTNAQLISAADRWYKDKVKEGMAEPRKVEAAVVVDGVEPLVTPEHGTTVVISPQMEHEIENKHAGSRLKKSTLSEHEDLVIERSLPGVLASIATTTRDLLELNPHIERVVVTAALQGFREKANKKTTMEALSQLFKNKCSKDVGVKERAEFARKHPTIVVMVDELAGDGAGSPFAHAVASWLDEQFIECFEGESPFTVVLAVSDASLANEVVMARYLNAGERAPDKVLVSSSGGSLPFQLSATRLRLGGMPRSTLHVMTNSFPAGKLNLCYRVKLSEISLEVIDGVMQSPRKAIREAAGEKLLDSALTEILSALNKGGQQVIYFAQDKAFLGQLQQLLVQEKRPGLDRDAIEILDSSVPASKRKELVEPRTRDLVKVFLMTSSGARGVSFPKTDWIIASVPRFNVEASLMEIAQLIYRGRGSYRDDSGVEVSGDHTDRHLVMLVDDFLIHQGPIDVRQWLRQALDLMTLLVMLRSTIFTRICGDSRLRQKVALVPVGSVGLDELISVMSQHVSTFLRESNVYIQRNSDRERIGLVKNAAANVAELFQSPKLKAYPKKGCDGRSALRPDDMQRIVDRTTAAVAPLLVPADDQSFIPDSVYFSGPVIVENWGQFEKIEAFTFEGHQKQLNERGHLLPKQLGVIDADHKLPGALRNPAASLRKLLMREDSGSAIEFNTLKSLKSPNTWVAIPAGYAQFCRRSADGHPYSVSDAPAWQEALGRSLNAGSACMPAVPSYESFPWAASVGQADPLKLSLVFDDRYFMASNELNFLNTLLLSEPASET